MATALKVGELQRMLLFVVDELQQLQAPPSERNRWWRHPIPGALEIPDFYSFASLKRRRRRSECQEINCEPARGERPKVDQCVIPIVDPCVTSQLDDACDSCVNVNADVMDEESIVDLVRCQTAHSMETDSDSYTALETSVESEKDTTPYPATIPSPVCADISGDQQCITNLVKNMVSTSSNQGDRVENVNAWDSPQESGSFDNDGKVEQKSGEVGETSNIGHPLSAHLQRSSIWHRDYVCQGPVHCPGCRQCMKRVKLKETRI